MAEYAEAADVNIVHLIYQQQAFEGAAKDYEFSQDSMEEHRNSGYEDTLRTLRHPEWLQRSHLVDGIAIHDLHREDPT
jgi:NTE family protein